MKTNLKLIVSSFVIALTLIAPILFSSTASATGFDELDATRQPMTRTTSPAEIKATYLLNYLGMGLDLPRTVVEALLIHTPQLHPTQLSYQMVANATLIYKPNPESDDGRIELKSTDTHGTFDLSKFGDDGEAERLLITTDLSVFLSVPHDPMLITLITYPAALKGQPPFRSRPEYGCNEETSPVLLFWRWSDDPLTADYVDYLTTATPLDMSSRTLYENWAHAHKPPTSTIYVEEPHPTALYDMFISFNFEELK